MKLLRRTASLCATCYRQIPAVVSAEPGGVVMRKTCPEHGAQEALVERDPVFYTYIRGLNSPSIYDGYFVDVTRRCNLRCKYCFYRLEAEDPEGVYSLDRVVSDCEVNVRLAPFILTGGEPTVRRDIVTLVREVQRVGPVELLTNGVRLAEKALYKELMPLLVNREGVANVNLSIHPETDRWEKVVEMCRVDRVRLESALIVVDSKASFLAALGRAQALADVVLAFRIKAASRIWAEQKPGKIFVSDMLGWLEEAGGSYQVVTQRNNKSVILNVLWAPPSGPPVFLMLVSWHDVENVDLWDIECAPWYRARNGEVANFVTAGLINEGMEKARASNENQKHRNKTGKTGEPAEFVEAAG